MSFWSGLKHTLGDVLKVGAPIAALAIPGVGPLAAAGIAAGGRAAGSALKDEKVNLGDVVKAGALTGGGKALFGANAGMAADAGPYANEPAVTGGGSPLDAVKRYIAKNPLDAARLGLAGVSTVQSAKTAGRADKAVQTALDQANRSVTPIDLAALFPQDSPYRKQPKGAL